MFVWDLNSNLVEGMIFILIAALLNKSDFG